MWLWSLCFRDSDQLRNKAWNERRYYTGVPFPFPEWADGRTDGRSTCDFRPSRALLLLSWCFFPARRRSLHQNIYQLLTLLLSHDFLEIFDSERKKLVGYLLCCVPFSNFGGGVLSFRHLSSARTRLLSLREPWRILLHRSVCFPGLFEACRGGLKFVRLLFSIPFFSPFISPPFKCFVSLFALLSVCDCLFFFAEAFLDLKPCLGCRGYVFPLS
jgi:hypothetical protein